MSACRFVAAALSVGVLAGCASTDAGPLQQGPPDKLPEGTVAAISLDHRDDKLSEPTPRSVYLLHKEPEKSSGFVVSSMRSPFLEVDQHGLRYLAGDRAAVLGDSRQESAAFGSTPTTHRLSAVDSAGRHYNVFVGTGREPGSGDAFVVSSVDGSVVEGSVPGLPSAIAVCGEQVYVATAPVSDAALALTWFTVDANTAATSQLLRITQDPAVRIGGLADRVACHNDLLYHLESHSGESHRSFHLRVINPATKESSVLPVTFPAGIAVEREVSTAIVGDRLFFVAERNGRLFSVPLTGGQVTEHDHDDVLAEKTGQAVFRLMDQKLVGFYAAPDQDRTPTVTVRSLPDLKVLHTAKYPTLKQHLADKVVTQVALVTTPS